MLFYTILFIGCIIAAIIIMRLVDILRDMTRSTQKFLLPDARQKRAKAIRNVSADSMLNSMPAHGSWNGNEMQPNANRTKKVRRQAKARKEYARKNAKPWGW